MKRARTCPAMADAAKQAVEKVVEGVKDLAVSKEQKKDQKEAKPKKEKKKKDAEGADGRPTELKPAPAFFDHRIQILCALSPSPGLALC